MKRKTDFVIGAFVINNDKLLLVSHKKLERFLPPGGHIEPGETPDEAVLREVKEETGLDVKIINMSRLGCRENTIEELATPFYANVHSVGDHNHACFYYLCSSKKGKVVISSESSGFKWVTRKELDDLDYITNDVKMIGRMAFDIWKKIR